MMNEPILSLAPMAGITDWPMRLLCSEQGCNYTTTEMISAMGLLQAPADSTVYRCLLSVSPDERPPVAQLFGHEPGYMARAAAKLTDMGIFSGIDINMGCPAPKVTGSGSGSALMRDLPLADKIIKAVRQSTSLPLSVKMRLGWDEQHITAPELAHICEENGCDLITVHGRTRDQQYSGQADWDAIAALCDSVHLPVLLNGDITTADDALRALHYCPCAGIAIGRGALGNPFIFSQITSALKGETPMLPTVRQLTDIAVRHVRLMAEWKGERGAVIEMRKHLCWYIHGKPGAARLRTRIVTTESLTDVIELLNEYAETTVCSL